MRTQLILTGALGFLAACNLENPSLTEEWQAEADAHGAMGRAGTFDVDGAGGGTFSIAGTIVVESVAPPYSMSNAGFADAVVDGVGTGTLSFSAGSGIHVAAGTIAPFAASSFNGQFGVSVNLDNTATPDGVEVTGLTLDNALAFFVAADAADPTAAPVELTATPEAPIVITSGRLVGGPVLNASAEGLTMTVADLGLGGAAGLTVSVDGEDAIDGADGVFARNVTLDCGAGDADVNAGETPFAACAGEGRITQAIVDGDVVIGANVEIQPFDEGFDEAPFSDELELEMAPGDARHIVFAFREKGYLGDGVVINVAATGDGADIIQVAAAPPEGPATTIIGQMQADGTIDAGETVVLVVAGPAIVIVDTITTIVDFFDSDSDSGEPPSPFPIPSWIQAGQVGNFTIVATVPSGANDGDKFPVVLTVEGANFETQSIAFTIVVDD